ncbi:PilA3 pilus assembly protein (plasmid) [Sinorhizobium fredii NGR234]|uniref:PilA3 pilus assembly protein n=1 Tax=Sinorhizobium fredii (strain NBRC 101917 / NGR234) TaxID=394 RepID=C3KQA9_SINFN|nr:Flp family type IVb pilin [Sinorhizobium fredii]ACP22267.1 PilA3 pilus assembly protein [Sinorhizobium fredii NGR234]
MKNLLLRFVRHESGATAIEYGLITGLIAVITAVQTVGTDIDAAFDAIAAAL